MREAEQTSFTFGPQSPGGPLQGRGRILPPLTATARRYQRQQAEAARAILARPQAFQRCEVAWAQVWRAANQGGQPQ